MPRSPTWSGPTRSGPSSALRSPRRVGIPCEGSQRVRTDLFVDFDFAYNVETAGEHVFLPRPRWASTPRTRQSPGFSCGLRASRPSRCAPSDGYITDTAVPIAVGQRYVVRSRVTCNVGVPKYAKLEILSFDEATRIVIVPDSDQRQLRVQEPRTRSPRPVRVIDLKRLRQDPAGSRASLMRRGDPIARSDHRCHARARPPAARAAGARRSVEGRAQRGE